MKPLPWLPAAATNGNFVPCVLIEIYTDPMIEVELNVDGMPIHRNGKSRKLPFLSKNCHS